MSEEDDIQTQCDGCNFDGAPLKAYRSRWFEVNGAADKYLCALCAATYLGAALDFPDHYPDLHAMQSAVYCANVVLARLDEIERLVRDVRPA